MSVATVTKVDSAKGVRWRAQVRRKGYPQQSSYFARKSDADRWARDLEAKIDAGKTVFDGAARRRTLSELISRYSEEFCREKRAPKTKGSNLAFGTN